MDYEDFWGKHIYIVWDCYNQNEFTSFIADWDYAFGGYITGKCSEKGYLVFDNCILNIDFGLPNPYFGIDYWKPFWNKGPMIDDNEQIIL